MPKMLRFFIAGTPATAGSKTAFINKKTGRAIVAPANKKQKPWMSHVTTTALEYYGGQPTTDPVILFLTFFLPRPKAHYGTGKNSGQLKETAPKFHTKKPDLTKLVRAVEDALTGIIWKDDSQVYSASYRKRYTDQRPGVEIEIRTAQWPAGPGKEVYGKIK